MIQVAIIIALLGVVFLCNKVLRSNDAHAERKDTDPVTVGVQQGDDTKVAADKARMAKETPEILGKLDGRWMGTMIDRANIRPAVLRGSISVDSERKAVELRFPNIKIGLPVDCGMWNADGQSATLLLGGAKMATVWVHARGIGQGSGAQSSTVKVEFQTDDGLTHKMEGMMIWSGR